MSGSLDVRVDGCTHGRPERVLGDIPAPLEDRKVRERDAGGLGAGGEDCEDGGVGVVFRDAPDGDERVCVVFIRNVADVCVRF